MEVLLLAFKKAVPTALDVKSIVPSLNSDIIKHNTNTK